MNFGLFFGAARRAARIGDGFFPARGDVKTLTGLLDAFSR